MYLIIHFMKELLEIGVMSAAKIQGILMFVIGCILTIIYLSIGAIMFFAGETQGGMIMMGFGIAAPLIYGIMGFVSGALFSFVYNFLAKRIGGLEIELR
jgi:hypothetical protein